MTFGKKVKLFRHRAQYSFYRYIFRISGVERYLEKRFSVATSGSEASMSSLLERHLSDLRQSQEDNLEDFAKQLADVPRMKSDILALSNRVAVMMDSFSSSNAHPVSDKN